jgi:hypothetical protein
MLGGARQVLVHTPEGCIMNDEEDKQVPGVPEFFKSWPGSDIVDWPEPGSAKFGKEDDEGGCWTGGKRILSFLHT